MSRKFQWLASLAVVTTFSLIATGCGEGDEPKEPAVPSKAPATAPAETPDEVPTTAPSTAAPSAGGVEYAFDVKGMDCGGCSGAVTTALKALPGVLDAKVSHETGKAVVTVVDASAIDEKKIMAAIVSLDPSKYTVARASDSDS